jgi:hypothetical protein
LSDPIACQLAVVLAEVKNKPSGRPQPGPPLPARAAPSCKNPPRLVLRREIFTIETRLAVYVTVS